MSRPQKEIENARKKECDKPRPSEEGFIIEEDGPLI